MRILVPAAAALAVLSVSAGCATPDMPRRPNAQEIADAEGLYALSDGFRAHLFGIDGSLYVRIGAGSEKELLLVAPHRYASRNGDVTVDFLPERSSDEAQRVVVAYYRLPNARPPIMFSTGPRPGRGFLD